MNSLWMDVESNGTSCSRRQGRVSDQRQRRAVISVGVQSPTEINAPLMMRTRAVWKELPDGNPRAAHKSRKRDSNSERRIRHFRRVLFL